MKTTRNFTRLFMGTMLIASQSLCAQDGLFISELADPADDYTGRFVEIFNAGPGTVDFDVDTFYLSRQSNGGTSWGEVQLTGSVAPDEAYVIGGSAFEAIYGFAPDQQTGILTGNGDDAYFLYRNGDHTAGTLHDIYGALDTDGTGEPWEYEDSRALRLEGIHAPRTTWTASEWEVNAANVADTDPGTHHGSSVGDTLPEGDYFLTVQDETFEAGQPVEVNITVNELTLADNIISYQFDVGFDPSVLEYTACDITGTIAEGGEFAVNANVTGQLSISYMTLTPLIGTGALLKIHFHSLAVDTSGISLSNAWLNNFPVNDLINGTIIIREVTPPTAEITYSDTVNRFADTLVIAATFSEAMDEANPVHLHLNGAVTLTGAEMMRQSATVYTYSYQIPIADGNVFVRLSNGTDLWGNEVDSVPTMGETFYIIPFTPGDVDDDGIILAYDAAITLQYSVGLDPLATLDPLPWEPWRDSTANVDGSGGVSAYDAGLILQYSAGVITTFPGQSTKSSTNAEVYIEVVGDEIVFYSVGELVGLNIRTTNNSGILGIPLVLDDRFLSAWNHTGNEYHLGLCTAFPPEDGDPFLKIPFNKSGTVTFHLMVNAKEEKVTVNLSTDIYAQKSGDVYIYPNPASDKLYINAAEFINANGCYVKIYNQYGKKVFEDWINQSFCEIDLSNWACVGLYYLHVTDAEGHIVARRKVILD